jgi:hypothetical protein
LFASFELELVLSKHAADGFVFGRLKVAAFLQSVAITMPDSLTVWPLSNKEKRVEASEIREATATSLAFSHSTANTFVVLMMA